MFYNHTSMELLMEVLYPATSTRGVISLFTKLRKLKAQQN